MTDKIIVKKPTTTKDNDKPEFDINNSDYVLLVRTRNKGNYYNRVCELSCKGAYWGAAFLPDGFNWDEVKKYLGSLLDGSENPILIVGDYMPRSEWEAFQIKQKMGSIDLDIQPEESKPRPQKLYIKKTFNPG